MNVVCQSSLARAGQDDKSNPQSWKRIFGSGTAVEEQERAAAAKFKSHLFPSSASLYLGKVETRLLIAKKFHCADAFVAS